MITVAKYKLKIYDLNADELPEGVEYVGSPTTFANPHAPDMEWVRGRWARSKPSASAAEKFREYVTKNLAIARLAREKLRGKSLCCWCAGPGCHAPILMELANEPEAKPAEKAKKGGKRR